MSRKQRSVGRCSASRVIHRYGLARRPASNIVLVVTASSHVKAAFAAAEFLMDYLTMRAPFWNPQERRHEVLAGLRHGKSTQPRQSAAGRKGGSRREAAE